MHHKCEIKYIQSPAEKKKAVNKQQKCFRSMELLHGKVLLLKEERGDRRRKVASAAEIVFV